MYELVLIHEQHQEVKRPSLPRVRSWLSRSDQESVILLSMAALWLQCLAVAELSNRNYSP